MRANSLFFVGRIVLHRGFGIDGSFGSLVPGSHARWRSIGTERSRLGAGRSSRGRDQTLGRRPCPHLVLRRRLDERDASLGGGPGCFCVRGSTRDIVGRCLDATATATAATVGGMGRRNRRATMVITRVIGGTGPRRHCVILTIEPHANVSTGISIVVRALLLVVVVLHGLELRRGLVVVVVLVLLLLLLVVGRRRAVPRPLIVPPDPVGPAHSPFHHVVLVVIVIAIAIVAVSYTHLRAHET